MAIEDIRRKDDEYLRGVSKALVQHDWAGATTLFMLQEKGVLTFDEGATEFEGAERTRQDLLFGLEKLEKVGLIELNDEQKYALTEKGADIASRLLSYISSDSNPNF